MKTGTKEFYELMDQFEKDIESSEYIDSSEYIYRTNFTRGTKISGKIPAYRFYEDGTVNKLFHAYMLGYESGQSMVIHIVEKEYGNG